MHVTSQSGFLSLKDGRESLVEGEVSTVSAQSDVGTLERPGVCTYVRVKADKPIWRKFMLCMMNSQSVTSYLHENDW